MLTNQILLFHSETVITPWFQYVRLIQDLQHLPNSTKVSSPWKPPMLTLYTNLVISPNVQLQTHLPALFTFQISRKNSAQSCFQILFETQSPIQSPIWFQITIIYSRSPPFCHQQLANYAVQTKSSCCSLFGCRKGVRLSLSLPADSLPLLNWNSRFSPQLV